MQSSPAISAPSQAPAPRAQRSNNKKSGLAPAHKQSQSQSTPQSTQPRNNARRSQRAPEQTHARHQSMPHQRPNTKPDMTNVTILKRSSAAPAASGPQASAVSDKTSDVQHKQKHQYQQHQQHQHQHYPNQKPRPQSQQQLPSKARRVQRRKDIEATTESLAQVDIDLALHQSPPLDPSSPPSSSDSDDSESALSPLPDIASRRRQLASNQAQRSTSAPAVPQLRTGHQEMDTKPQRVDVYPSRASLPVEVQRPMHTKTNSADKVMMAEKKSTLYAGPTFHNSPAPTSLPIPVFARSAGNSPTEKIPAPFFGEAASPQLNSTRPLAPAPSWHGHYSMPMAMNYNVPDRMATSSFPQISSGPYNGDQLMEISQNLRMLLRIQSQ